MSHCVLWNMLACESSELAIVWTQASKVFTFRRGTTQAGINCLAFSAEGVSPQLLACASSHGTVHLWNLERPSTFATRTSSGLLASVIPSSMTDYVDPQRCIVNLRLPAGVPRICAIQVILHSLLQLSSWLRTSVVTLYVTLKANSLAHHRFAGEEDFFRRQPDDGKGRVWFS